MTNKVSLNKSGVKIKSNSQYLVWPPAALSTAVHLLLMDCTRFASSCCEMLPHSTKAVASSRTFLGGMALAFTLRSNRSQTCSMGLRSELFIQQAQHLHKLMIKRLGSVLLDFSADFYIIDHSLVLANLCVMALHPLLYCG